MVTFIIPNPYLVESSVTPPTVVTLDWVPNAPISTYMDKLSERGVIGAHKGGTPKIIRGGAVIKARTGYLLEDGDSVRLGGRVR